MSMLLREKIMKFCYLKCVDMQNWVERYEEAKRARTLDRQRFSYNGPNAIVRRDASGFFAIDSTKLWTNESDTFVLPQHCE